MYRGLLERNHVFSDLAASKSWQPSLTGVQQAERLNGQRVSSSFFRVLGVGPVLGRDFDEADDVVRGPNHGAGCPVFVAQLRKTLNLPEGAAHAISLLLNEYSQRRVAA